MNILIRVDASMSIGIGHAMRCLVLAEKFKHHGDSVYFLSRTMEPTLITLIESSGHYYTALTLAQTLVTPAEMEKLDAETTIEVLQRFNTTFDMAVVDSYVLGEVWEAAIKTYINRLVVIDDMPNRRHLCDIIIDQTYHRQAQDYNHLVPQACIKLVGQQYAILRREFAELRQASVQRRKNQSAVKKVLINFGGGESAATVLTVLNSIELSTIEPAVEFIVILSQASVDYEKVVNAASATARRIKVYSNVNNMAELLSNSDLVIGAGGTSSYERCCLGIPALVILCAENQRENMQALAQAGAIISLGEWRSLDAQQLATQLSAILLDHQRIAKTGLSAGQVCDGLGADRIFNIIHPRVAQDGQLVTLRAVTEDDIEQLYEWQSRPETRAYARTTRVPRYHEHCAWVKQQLTLANNFFCIVSHAQQSAGVLRLQFLNEQERSDIPVSTIPSCAYEISIYINPEKYRLGLGVIALSYADALVPGALIKAYVMQQNSASQKLFLKAGYTKVSDDTFIRHVCAGG